MPITLAALPVSSPKASRFPWHLAQGRPSGGLDVEAAGSGAWYDLGLVERGDDNQNNRKSPEYPGNFTCEAGTDTTASDG